MSTQTYATERELAVALLAYRDRAAAIRDERAREAGLLPLSALVPRYGGGMFWGDDPPRAASADIPVRRAEGEPASGKQTAAIVGTLICFCLLLIALAYLAWSGAHGSYIWR